MELKLGVEIFILVLISNEFSFHWWVSVSVVIAQPVVQQIVVCFRWWYVLEGGIF